MSNPEPVGANNDPTLDENGEPYEHATFPPDAENDDEDKP